MNTEKVVYKYLFGKVELASSKDLDKKLNQLFNEQKKADKIRTILEQSTKDFQSTKNNLEIYVKESESLLNEFANQAGELGISPDSVSVYKQLNIEVSNTKSEYLK
tara:strand:- start:69 stop:386 length:318 start_codon:yes stop_codon:yes gene_type:complete